MPEDVVTAFEELLDRVGTGTVLYEHLASSVEQARRAFTEPDPFGHDGPFGS